MSAKKPNPARGKRPAPAAQARAAQSPPIVREMVVEALESWVVPTLAVASAVVFWLLSQFEVWPEAVAVVGVAGALLVLTLFSSFRPYFFKGDAQSRAVAVVSCVTWGVFLLAVFLRHNFPGAPVAGGVLRVGGESIALPAGRHALVVDGRFTAQPGQGNRLGHYRLEITPSGGGAFPVEGSFEDSFAHQRLGRRGTTVVEIQHTSQRHVVLLPTDGKLRVAESDASLDPDLRVTAYPAASPWIFPILGVAGIVGALVLEKWLDGDGSATMAVSVTFFVVDQYLRWASPHPQLRSLIGAILVGGIIGAPLAAIVWRLVPRRWVVRRH
jgi:hypothetical protein